MLLPFIMEYMYEGGEPEFNHSKFYENYIYLLKDNKILKLGITIDKKIIEQNFSRLIRYIDEKNFIIVDEEEMENYCFPIDMEYVGKYKLNKRKKTNNYKIPNKSTADCDLIYQLNELYNKHDLDSSDLYFFNNERKYCKEESTEMFASVWVSVIENIVSNLKIEIVEEYDYEKLFSSIDFIENIAHKERILSRINLKHLKIILKEAEMNEETFNDLKINIIEEKEKQKVK